MGVKRKKSRQPTGPGRETPEKGDFYQREYRALLSTKDPKAVAAAGGVEFLVSNRSTDPAPKPENFEETVAEATRQIERDGLRASGGVESKQREWLLDVIRRSEDRLKKDGIPAEVWKEVPLGRHGRLEVVDRPGPIERYVGQREQIDLALAAARRPGINKTARTKAEKNRRRLWNGWNASETAALANYALDLEDRSERISVLMAIADRMKDQWESERSRAQSDGGSASKKLEGIVAAVEEIVLEMQRKHTKITARKVWERIPSKDEDCEKESGRVVGLGALRAVSGALVIKVGEYEVYRADDKKHGEVVLQVDTDRRVDDPRRVRQVTFKSFHRHVREAKAAVKERFCSK